MKVIVCVIALVALAQGGILRVPRKGLPSFHGNSRIVGGEEAGPHQFPYQMGLNMTWHNGEHHFCGASLISERYVLTAAHCADQAASIEVIMGAHKVQEQEPGQQRQVSTEFHVHEGWNPNTLMNDLALIKLPKAVTLTESVGLVKLPTWTDADNDYTDADAIISGWGKNSDDAPGITPNLQFLDTLIISNEECQDTFGSDLKVTMICAKGKKVHQSTCNGDSGGPLVTVEDGVIRQIGVTSFITGYGCETSAPFAFSRVTKYLDWIEKNSDVVIEQ